MTVCLTEVRQAAQELLSEEDAKALIKEIQDRARAKAQAKAISYEQALRESADDMAAQMDRDVAGAKYREYLNMVKRIDRQQYYTAFQNDAKAIKALTVGIQSSAKGSRQSTSLMQKKIASQLLGGFYRDLKDADLVKAFNSKDYEQQLAAELFQPGSTKNVEARKIADIYKKWNKNVLKMLRKEGAEPGELEEYMGRQSHDPERLRQTEDGYLGSLRDRMDYFKERQKTGEKYDPNYFYEKGFKRWADYILPRLDAMRTFDGAEPMQYLRSAYDALISGVHKKPETDMAELYQASYAFQGPGNLAKKVSQERKLHFKDGISFYEYNQKFGHGSMHANLIRSFETAGNNIGLMRIWGTNPEAAFKADIRELQERTENRRNAKVSEQLHLDKLTPYFSELTGLTRSPVNGLGARIMANLRGWTSMTKLGYTTLRSIPDIANRAAQIHASTGQSFLGGLRDTAFDVLKGRPKGEMEKIADLTNVWSRSVFDYTIARFSAADSPGGLTTKMMQKFFKFSAMHWWDETLKKSAGTNVARGLAQMKGMSFDKLHPNAQYTFKLYGIDHPEWELMRTAQIKSANNQLFITPDAMQRLKDEDIARYLNKNVGELKPYEIEQVKSQMEDRLGGYFIDQADQVVLDQDAGTRRAMLQGTRPGTLSGEVLRSIAQFKMWGLGMTRNILGRDITRLASRLRDADGLHAKWLAGKGDILGLAQFIGSITGLWYLGNSMADIAKGRTPRPVDSPKTWAAALIGGGGFGIYGDFLFGEYTKTRFGSSAIETLAGPVAGEASSFLKLLGHLESGDDPTNAAFQFAKNNTPFLNLFYTRIALDYAILYGIQERASPGSLRRMEHRLRKDQEQEFIFAPSQYALGQ